MFDFKFFCELFDVVCVVIVKKYFDVDFDVVFVFDVLWCVLF